MGEVYRARDTKLGREVALKILPETFTHDPERVARFRREAQVLAALNHPHIGAIYGLDEADGQQFLVLELIDGETLADRIANGPLPLDETLTIATQVAEALEAAHEKGIIHRDLKPANIALTSDGHVKVLDFGLAKAMDPASATSVDLANSPTLTSPAAMTGVGVILGTAAYMSPEQAKGRGGDKRSDVWAFGCVLYEMLTGTRAFEGEDLSETLAAVLRGEPDWRALPALLPPSVRALVEGCLTKDRQQRIGDMSVARFLLHQPTLAFGAVPTPAAPPPRWFWRHALPPMATTAVIAVAITGAIAWRIWPSTPQPTITRFPIALGDGHTFTNGGRQELALSPDGTRLAYVANAQVYLRSMSEVLAKPIAGTESSQGGVTNPVFSPDGRSVAFYSPSEHALKRIAVTGGAAVTICPADYPYGMSWDRDEILFSQGSTGILRVSARGGTPELIVGVKTGEVAYGPQLLPGGQAVLFTLATGTNAVAWDTAQIVVQSLTSGQRTILISGGSDARYLPTGHLVYAHGGVVFAVRFDLRQLAVVGGPVPVIEGVSRAFGVTGAAQFSTAQSGTLVYVPGPVSTSLTPLDLAVMDRQAPCSA
jgi:hypothetical protein